MRKNNKKFSIIYFSDDGEVKATRASYFFVSRELRKLGYSFDSIGLKKKTWLSQVNSLDKNGRYFILSHGGIAEDGALHAVLEKESINHTGHSSASMSNLINKYFTKIIYHALGILTPDFYYRGTYFNVGTPFSCRKENSFYVKKPINGGSKKFIKKVKTFFDTTGHFIYERFIPGDLEVSISVIGDFNNYKILKPIVRKRALFNKRKNIIKRITKVQRDICIEYAKKIHKGFDCRGLVKTDMLIDLEGRVWVIETDALPGLSFNNSTIQSVTESNMSLKTFFNLLLKLNS